MEMIEVDINSFTTVRAWFKWVDDSYDHAFGREKVLSWDIKKIEVVKYFVELDRDKDVTASLNDEDLLIYTDIVNDRIKERIQKSA